MSNTMNTLKKGSSVVLYVKNTVRLNNIVKYIFSPVETSYISEIHEIKSSFNKQTNVVLANGVHLICWGNNSNSMNIDNDFERDSNGDAVYGFVGTIGELNGYCESITLMANIEKTLNDIKVLNISGISVNDAKIVLDKLIEVKTIVESIK